LALSSISNSTPARAALAVQQAHIAKPIIIRFGQFIFPLRAV
jgi:hypothetical protein